jgi:hypothetical protein
MKNELPDLQTHIFEMIDWILDREIKGEALDEEIKRGLAFVELAKIAVANGALMVKAVDTLYGIPVSDKVPLIPKIGSDTFDKKTKQLFIVPKIEKDDESYGYKKGKRQPI